MQKYYIFIVFTFSTFTLAQVGINTEKPTKTLDINGELRVREINEQTSSPVFILIPDDNGVINKIRRESVISDPVTEDSGSSVKKIQLLRYDNTKTISNGLFEFRINGINFATSGDMTYQVRMTSNPNSTVTLTSATVARWGGAGDQTPIAFNGTLRFDSSNYDVWQTISTITRSLNGHNTIVSVDLANSPIISDDTQFIFYNLIAQRVDDGLKTLIITRY